MKPTATRIVIAAENPIEPAPTAAATLFDKRGPIRARISALAKGNVGMSHNRRITSAPHFAQFVDVQRLEAVIDFEHKSQTYGDFGSRHRQDEQKHDLPVGLMPSSPGDHECQTRRIEHHLQRHEDENQITAYEQAGQSQREQDPRQ